MPKNKYLFELPAGFFLLCCFGPASCLQLRYNLATHLDPMTVAVVTLDDEPDLCLPVAAVCTKDQKEKEWEVFCVKRVKIKGVLT